MLRDEIKWSHTNAELKSEKAEKEGKFFFFKHQELRTTDRKKDPHFIKMKVIIPTNVNNHFKCDSSKYTN